MQKRLVFLLALLFLLSVPASVWGQDVYQGRFVIFMGDQEIGHEDFTISPEEITTTGLLSVGGQTIELSAELTAETYSLKYMGITLSGTFADGKFNTAAGPVKLAYDLTEPYLVLDNNVFAHYQQVINLAQSGVDTAAVVTPVLVLMSQPPVLEGQILRGENATYTVNGELIDVAEYGIIFAGNLYVRVLAHDGRLVMVDIPAQGVKAVNADYMGMALNENMEALGGVSEDFLIPSGEVTLAGTLTLPEGSGPFPAVLLNSGSGPQDRDGNTPPGFMTNMFKLMSEHFSELGIAVLRYDERGVGESTGDYNEATFHDLVDDVRALVAFLKEHPSIDTERIVVLGHSEGASIVSLIASEDPELAGVILLGGPSLPLDEIMIEQLEYQASLDFLSDAERQMIAALIPQTEQVLADARAGKSESVMSINLEWLRQHMAFDPKATISKVEKPVLIVHGAEDLKVRPYHAQALADALMESGNTHVEVHILPKTTHEFMLFPIDNPAYDPTNPWKTEPQLYEIIGEWLQTILLNAE